MPARLDLTPDQLLSTTRAVRKRLDLSRPVELAVIRECLELALQAPSGSNAQGWQFVVVTDRQRRKELAEIYARAFALYREMPFAAGNLHQDDPERAPIQARVMSSAEYLAAHLAEVPVHVIPCIAGRVDGQPSAFQASVWASIMPAAWSFMLAARARGLGTSWTSLHLMYEQEAAEVLGIPYDAYSQAALIPVAYTRGTDFESAPRVPLDQVLHVDRW